jgi:PTH1 family peptidyl-tRNA hydrolase
MKIIIGLGNPGPDYRNTRHNIGFEFLDDVQNKFDFPAFNFNKKFNAEVSEGIYQKEKVILAKPQTFMNLSGIAVRSILDFYKLSPNDTIIIQDDIDLAIGTFKIATDSRSAGHNGVQNIINQLGTQKFTRLRIGIGKVTTDTPSCRLGVHDFVLGKFSQTESEKIISIFPDLLQVLLHQFN